MKNKSKAVHTVKAATGKQILKAIGISMKQYKKYTTQMFNTKKI